LFSDHEIDWKAQQDEELKWTLVLPRTKLGPHRQHYFQLENVEDRKFTHVRVTIYPDGGLKRVRIIGRRADTTTATIEPSIGALKASLSAAPEASDSLRRKLIETAAFPVLPLTPEAFAPFGHVLQAYGDHNAKPKGTRITSANDGTASKFHKLSLLSSSYPANTGATAGISIYRCKPLEGIATDGTVNLTALERHPYTQQAFIPMGRGPGEGLSETADRYMVVVARNGEDDRPDLGTVRAFMATTAQGLAYNTAVWRE
jgi:allantoicase